MAFAICDCRGVLPVTGELISWRLRSRYLLILRLCLLKPAVSLFAIFVEGIFLVLLFCTAKNRAGARRNMQRQAGQAVHHRPILVKSSSLFWRVAHHLEMKYRYPRKWLLAKFGTTPEAAFGAYTPEKRDPWYTIMFVLACISPSP